MKKNKNKNYSICNTTKISTTFIKSKNVNAYEFDSKPFMYVDVMLL